MRQYINPFFLNRVYTNRFNRFKKKERKKKVPSLQYQSRLSKFRKNRLSNIIIITITFLRPPILNCFDRWSWVFTSDKDFLNLSTSSVNWTDVFQRLGQRFPSSNQSTCVCFADNEWILVSAVAILVCKWSISAWSLRCFSASRCAKMDLILAWDTKHVPESGMIFQLVFFLWCTSWISFSRVFILASLRLFSAIPYLAEWRMFSRMCCWRQLCDEVGRRSSRINCAWVLSSAGFRGVCSWATLVSSISHNGWVSSGGVDGRSVCLHCSRASFSSRSCPRIISPSDGMIPAYQKPLRILFSVSACVRAKRTIW